MGLEEDIPDPVGLGFKSSPVAAHLEGIQQGADLGSQDRIGHEGLIGLSRNGKPQRYGLGQDLF